METKTHLWGQLWREAGSDRERQGLWGQKQMAQDRVATPPAKKGSGHSRQVLSEVGVKGGGPHHFHSRPAQCPPHQLSQRDPDTPRGNVDGPLLTAEMAPCDS